PPLGWAHSRARPLRAMLAMRSICRGDGPSWRVLLRFRKRPVHLLQPFGLEESIPLREMPTTEEPAMRGQRRRMRRFQHEVARGIDNGRFLLRVAAPEHEHDRGGASVHLPND